MSDDLKPCPFCGGIMEMTLDEKYFVHGDKTCFGRHISIVATDFARIAAWNTRADADRIEQLEYKNSMSETTICALNTAWDQALDQRNEAQTKLAKAVEVMKALQKDMLERSRAGMDTIHGNEYRIVNAGRTAWIEFCAVLAELEGK